MNFYLPFQSTASVCSLSTFRCRVHFQKTPEKTFDVVACERFAHSIIDFDHQIEHFSKGPCTAEARTPAALTAARSPRRTGVCPVSGSSPKFSVCSVKNQMSAAATHCTHCLTASWSLSPLTVVPRGDCKTDSAASLAFAKGEKYNEKLRFEAHSSWPDSNAENSQRLRMQENPIQRWTKR